MQRADADEASDVDDFLQAIKEGAHLFQGITDSTMTHGEGWQFIQAGRSLERAAALATLLGVHFQRILRQRKPSPSRSNGSACCDPAPHLRRTAKPTRRTCARIALPNFWC